MDNGTIQGHGAYLGPDYSANAPHDIGDDTAAALAQQQYDKPVAALTSIELAAIRAQVAVTLKTNRFDAASNTLHLTTPEAAAYRQQVIRWTAYFHDPAKNGRLKPDLITDPTELHQLTAFITWAAWASVADRPGSNYSYTNNFPYDLEVGNLAPPGALLWSALSLVVLDAWDFVRTTRGDCDICEQSIAVPHKWTFYYLIAVGFWNFLGAGVFGFLINLPIISYYEVSTILTPKHGHAAMMGVFGMLAIALMVFVLRQTTDDAHWPGIEKYIKVTGAPTSAC